MHAKSQKYKNLALFDFDGTLYEYDSFTGFIFYSLSKRHILKRGLITLPWIMAYYLKLYPAHKMRPRLFKGMFKSVPQHQIKEKAESYAAQLVQALNPKLLNQLQKHQAHGDDIVLVSASINIYLEAVCELLNIDLICSQVALENSIFSGEYLTADCSLYEKKQQIIMRYDLEQYNAIYAYGNSYEDDAMLSLATYSYMVGVDHSLPEIVAYKKLA
ncbi:haloacid dehalogenase-like hydrolase [Acinetobacter indicus]|uniref:HAD-IB family phosphatase n=1 Tax=Acinetobacter indicus TaxID=756892 RepID=UPI002578B729|nr:HAD-IB family phosphatase [Acinetobacter indicus]MDM1279219.1 haloacid dehalogenase-like hydrolase [Acinetobacter indicus]